MIEMITAKEILDFLKKQKMACMVRGNEEVSVDGFASLNHLSDRRLIWIKEYTEEKKEELEGFRELVVISKDPGEARMNESCCWILCEDPKGCFFSLLEAFYTKEAEPCIAPTAVIQTRNLGGGYRVSVGHGSFLGEGVTIGHHVQIGCHVVLEGKVSIGDYSIIHSGAVIGKSGFGYYNAPEGRHKKVPHFGGVSIADHVEIGANTCIDCGTMDDTVIESHVKIDNLCHIGHNVRIGENAMLVAGTILCGSCRIGKNSYIGPGSVIKNQISLGDNSFVGMQTAVMRNVKEDESVFGVPGRPFQREYRV